MNWLWSLRHRLCETLTDALWQPVYRQTIYSDRGDGYILPTAQTCAKLSVRAANRQRRLKLCDSLLQFISSLSAVVLRNGELGLERASLSDDCLHGQQLVNQILHTGQEHATQLSAQSWQHETPRLSHLYTYVVFPTWNVMGWVSGCKRRVWGHSGYMSCLNVLWESQEYFYTTRHV